MARKPTYEELQQRVEELERAFLERKHIERYIEKLNFLKEKLLVHASLNEKLKRVTDGIIDIFDADFARIWIIKTGDLCDNDCFHAAVTEGPHVCRYREQCLHLMVSSGRYTHTDGSHKRVPFGCYKIGRIASGDEPKFLTNDVINDHRVHDREWARTLNLAAFAGYKLHSADGKPIGVLALFTKQAIKSEEDALLEGFANTTAQVIQTGIAGEALRASEERYRETVDLLPSIVCEYDTSGRFTYVNTYGLKTFGYTLSELEEGLYAAALFPADEIEKFKGRFSLLLKGKTSESAEYRLQSKDGSIIYAIADSAPIYRDEKIVGVRSSVTPINERKQVEEALLKSEERYRELSDLLPQIVFETDKSGNITFANRIAFELFGYTEDDYKKGINAFEILIPEDRKRAKENIKRILNGEKLGGTEYTALRKDGASYPMLIHSSPIISEGKPVGLRGIMVNLSEIKQAQDALKESEEKYRLLFEHANDAIFIIQDGRIKFPNSMTEELTGYSKEELSKIPFKNLIHPEDRDMVLERRRERLKGEKPPSTYSFRIINQSGEKLWVQINAALITWEGNPASINFLRDTTEQKHLENQLQQAQRMESLGTLAGGIAHDFNNLLMGIQGRTSLMLMDADSYHPNYEHLKGIEDYVRSASDLTKQLLGFAMGGKYEVKPVDLNLLINKTAQLFGRTKKEINIHRKRQKGIWTVEVDNNQIEQVLLNLCVNAWQSMPGGGELYLETENVKLDVDDVRSFSIEPGKYVKISVTDTGVGMDKGTQERIFDPFFTTKEMGRGTGLGLASAYGIIKNHNGIINVDSEKGEGTTFTIYLPASEKEVVDEKKLSEEVLKGGETVLLVDDEEMIIEVAKELLTKLGYKVLVAKSGKAAVELYAANRNEIDMVILDMIMPDMGGGETYDKLKEIDAEINVLLSSGYSVDGQATEILKRGCNGFIQKPFNMMDLSQKIREILDRN